MERKGVKIQDIMENNTVFNNKTKRRFLLEKTIDKYTTDVEMGNVYSSDENDDDMDIIDSSVDNDDVDIIDSSDESISNTDERFMNKLNNTLEPWSPASPKTNGVIINTMMMSNRPTVDIRESNSPITLSRSSSEPSFGNEDESDSVKDTLNETYRRLKLLKSPKKIAKIAKIAKIDKINFRNLSFKEIEHSLDTFDSTCKLSNELDIIITYLNGQKHLYLHSKIYTHFKLNLLMVPTLIISSVVTTLSQFIGTSEWPIIVIPILNATLTLLVSLVSFFKLESSSQIYANMATQYDKLQTILEVANSHLIFLDDELEQNILVVKTIKEFEIKIFEIKDSNTIFIPERVKRQFPLISHINIFSFIKRIATYRKSLIHKYRDAKNEIRYILYKINNQEMRDDRGKTRIAYLTDIKTKLRDELIEYKNVYSYMDDAFVQEIKNAEFEKFWSIQSISGYRHRRPRTGLHHELIKKHIPQF